MFYSILRQITATVFKIYFRKIYLSGKEKVPHDKPLLLASNHPMAFSEACLLACFLDRPLHFLVRGDVFVAKWKWFFDWTNQIPIYRFRDGFSNMRKNASSFDLAHQALADNKVILIFSEGNTKLQKKLSPLQKGTARLAFGAHENKGVDNLEVVPIGINYNDGTRFRSDVMIQVGEPLKLADYIDDYKEDHISTLKTFTNDLYDRMLPLVIHVEEDQHVEVANQVFDFYEAQSPYDVWPVVDADDTRFEKEKAIADRINAMEKTELDTLSTAISKLKKPFSIKVSLPSLIAKAIVVIMGAPLAFGGYILNAIPFYIPKNIADKKTKHIEFYTPVRLGLMMVLYIIYLVLALIIALTFFGAKGWLVILLLPLSGYWTILWWELVSTVWSYISKDRDGDEAVQDVRSWINMQFATD